MEEDNKSQVKISLLDQYIKEISEDLKLEPWDIKKAQLQLHSKKHKWVGILVRHKQDLFKLKESKENFLRTAISSAKPKISISSQVLRKQAESSDVLVSVNARIREIELVIELLEKTEKVFQSMTYDIKNIIDIMKMEQM